VYDKVITFFNKIDIDGSKTIDKKETLKYWSNSFAKLSSQELFNQVDMNGDGSIQLDEWIDFWTVVYNSGYTEDEIISEVKTI
jgi:Ca2+-binding EF-hand superfamily protein